MHSSKNQDARRVLFKKNKWLYYPISLSGAIITLFIAALIIQIFLFANSRKHSVSDLFYAILPYIISYLAIYVWIASPTSRTDARRQTISRK